VDGKRRRRRSQLLGGALHPLGQKVADILAASDLLDQRVHRPVVAPRQFQAACVLGADDAGLILQT
jgi:hypothetical protein